MWFKEIIKKGFKDDKTELLHKYDSAKLVFIFMCLLFFLSFFFAWAGFHREIFLYAFSFIYILTLLSLDIYVYLFFKKSLYWKITWFRKFLLIFILLILSFFLIFPIIIDWGIVEFYNILLNFWSTFNLDEFLSKV